MARIDGQSELLERHGAENRATIRRPCPEHRRELPSAEADAHFAKRVGDGLVPREHRELLVRCRKLESRDEIRRKQDVGGTRIDEKLGLDGSVAVVRVKQRGRNDECAHWGHPTRLHAAWECSQMVTVVTRVPPPPPPARTPPPSARACRAPRALRRPAPS